MRFESSEQGPAELLKVEEEVDYGDLKGEGDAAIRGRFQTNKLNLTCQGPAHGYAARVVVTSRLYYASVRSTHRRFPRRACYPSVL